MRKIRFGIGGLFLLWVIGVAIWAAVALAQIARGETVGSVTPQGNEIHLRGPCRAYELRYQIPADPTRAERAILECAGELIVVCDEFSDPDVSTTTAPHPVVAPLVAEARPGLTLSLAPPPSPLRGPLVASLALSSASPASLALFDVTGRRVVADEIGSLGPGAHRVPVANELAAGVYWLVLRQQGAESKTRVVALR